MFNILKLLLKNITFFIFSGVLSSRERHTLDNSLNNYGQKLDKRELMNLITTNNHLSKKLKKQILKVYSKMIKEKGGNSVDINEFKKALKDYHNSRIEIRNRYLREKRKIHGIHRHHRISHRLHSRHKVGNHLARGYSRQLDMANGALESYESNVLGRHDIISRNIGLYGALNGLFENQPTSKVERYLKEVAGRNGTRILSRINEMSAGRGPRVKKQLVVSALKTLISYAMSGGTSIALDLFGIKIGETAVNKGKMYHLLKAMGVKNPIRLSDLIKAGKINPRDGEEIARKMAGEHFAGGTERVAINTIIFNNAPFILRTLLRLFGRGNRVYGLLKRFESRGTGLKEKARLARQITEALEPCMRKLDRRISELSRGNVHGDPLAVLNDRAYSKDKAVRRQVFGKYIKDAVKLKKIFQKAFQMSQNVADQFGDLKRNVYGGRSRREILRANKSFDSRFGLRPRFRLRGVGKGKFGVPLPTKLTRAGLKKWLYRMEHGYVGSPKYGTAMSNLVNYIEEAYNIRGITLGDMRKAILNGRYLNERGRMAFKSILTKNMSRYGGGNLKIGNYPIFAMKVRGRTVFLKQNCSNVEDVTPDLLVNVYKPEYFTITTTINLRHPRNPQTPGNNPKPKPDGTRTRTNSGEVSSNSNTGTGVDSSGVEHTVGHTTTQGASGGTHIESSGDFGSPDPGVGFNADGAVNQSSGFNNSLL